MDELVPLAAAASKAYLALAACMPIYGARAAGAPLEPLSDADMAGGKFIQGAAALHFRSGKAPFTRLAVRAADLDAGISRLKGAGVNFSQARFEPAPRRIPRVAPA